MAMPRNEFADHPGKGEEEELSQEVEPIEVDPHMWPEETKVTLAALRKSGESTTAAHIAEINAKSTTND